MNDTIIRLLKSSFAMLLPRRTSADKLPAISEQRKLDPEKLTKLVQGELDWIVMAALEKQRSRRYETASAFAVDLQHYLNEEPISRGPPTARYRMRKFVHKHRTAVAVASVVALLATVGIGVVIWQWRDATKARKLAESAKSQAYQDRARAEKSEKAAKVEAAKSQQVAGLLKRMLEGVSPSVALGRDTTMLREILDAAVARIANDLKEQPDVEAEVREIIGITYFDLGLYPQAEEMHRESLRLRERFYGPQDRRAQRAEEDCLSH